MKQIQTTGLLVLLCLLYSSIYADNFLTEDSPVKKAEIISIATKRIHDATQSIDSVAPIKYFVRGYRGFIEPGLNLEKNKEGNYNWIKVNFIHTYQFKPGLMLGLGVGLQNNLKNRDRYLFPLFVALRAQSSHLKKVEPFFSIYAGYTVIPEKQFNQGGYFVNPQAGVDIKMDRKSSVYFGVGVELKRGTFHAYDWMGGISATTVDLFHLSFSVGFTF